MFYVPELLKKNGNYFFVWIAATQQGNALKKYLPPRKVREIRIHSIVNEILKTVVQSYPRSFVPRAHLTHLSLYLSTKLLFGSCIVLHKQAALLFHDISDVLKNIHRTRWSKEKNELVIEKIRKTKSKLGKGTQGGDEVNDEKDAEWDVVQVSDLSFFYDDDAEALEFHHSVSAASITLAEEVNYSMPAQDMRFGDEDSERHPVYALPTSVLYGDAEEMAMGEDGPPTVEPFVLQHGDSPLEPAILTEPANQHQQAADEARVTVPPLQDEIGYLNESAVNHQDIFVADPTSNPIPHLPYVTSSEIQLTDEIGTAVSPQQDEIRDMNESPVRQQDISLPDPNSEPITPHHLDTSERIQLSDLEETPRRLRKRRVLIVDRFIQIPSYEYKERISNGAVDTLRKKTVYAKSNETVDLLSHPFRKQKAESLTTLIQRNFISHVAPTLDITNPMPTLMKDYADNIPPEITARKPPRKRGPKVRGENQGSPRAKRPKTSDGLRNEVGSNIMRDTERSEVNTSGLEVDISKRPLLSKQSGTGVPSLNTTGIDHTKLSELQLSVIDLPEQPQLQFDGTPQVELTYPQTGVNHLVEQSQHQIDESDQAEQPQPQTVGAADQAEQAQPQIDAADQAEQFEPHMYDNDLPEERGPFFESNTNYPPASPIPPSPPIEAIDVLAEINSLTVGSSGSILFEALCPISTTHRRKAAKVFENLLDLHFHRRTQLTQQLDGVTIPSIKIQILD